MDPRLLRYLYLSLKVALDNPMVRQAAIETAIQTATKTAETVGSEAGRQVLVLTVQKTAENGTKEATRDFVWNSFRSYEGAAKNIFSSLVKKEDTTKVVIKFASATGASVATAPIGATVGGFVGSIAGPPGTAVGAFLGAWTCRLGAGVVTDIIIDNWEDTYSWL